MPGATGSTDQFLDGTRQEQALQEQERLPETQQSPNVVAPPPTPEPEAPVGIDALTATLYQQLLGLMDQSANTDLANSQISNLNSILQSQGALAGKDLAAGGWGSGSAQPADISGILRGQQTALSQGIVGIQTAAQQRADMNTQTALIGLINLRSQLSNEQQQEVDNKLNAAMFEWQQFVDEKGFEFTEEELELKKWEIIGNAFGDVLDFFDGPG
jgi:hypothetical protein